MRLLIAGKGKMAKVLTELAEKRGDEVLGCFDAFDPGVPADLPAADAVLDFSHRDNLPWVADYVRAHGCALVYGTTGLTEDDRASLRALSETAPVFFAANYSYGVAVLQKLLALAAPLLKDDFDIELVETHHNQKQDAPSGTAKALLQILDPADEYQKVYGRSGQCGARGREIGVHAVRGGSEAGEHSVMFFGDSESITITHHASDRRIFAAGALKAAAFACGRTPGMYDMNDLLG